MAIINNFYANSITKNSISISGSIFNDQIVDIVPNPTMWPGWYSGHKLQSFWILNFYEDKYYNTYFIRNIQDMDYHNFNVTLYYNYYDLTENGNKVWCRIFYNNQTYQLTANRISEYEPADGVYNQWQTYDDYTEEIYYIFNGTTYYAVRTKPINDNQGTQYMDIESINSFYLHPFPTSSEQENYFLFTYSNTEYKWEILKPITSLITNLNDFLIYLKSFYRWINQTKNENSIENLSFGIKHLTASNINSIFEILGSTKKYSSGDYVQKSMFNELEQSFNTLVRNYYNFSVLIPK